MHGFYRRKTAWCRLESVHAIRELQRTWRGVRVHSCTAALRGHEGLSRNLCGHTLWTQVLLLSSLPFLFASSCFITATDHFLSAAVFFLGGLVSLDQIRPLLAVNFLRPMTPPTFFADLICLRLAINSRTPSCIFVSEAVLLISPYPQRNVLFAED